MRKALVILFVLGFGLITWWVGFGRREELFPGRGELVGVEVAGTWQSGIKVQNLSPTTATVSLQFIGEDGAAAGDVVRGTLGPWASREFYLAALTLPDGRYSVAVRSDAPVAAVATQTHYDDRVADSYPASAGAPRVSVPALYRGFNDWYSAIFVQNAASTTATVRLRVDGAGRAPLTVTASVAPRATQAFDTQSATFDPLGRDFLGAATISAQGGQPLVVTVFQRRMAAGVHILASPKGIEDTTPSNILALPTLYRRVNSWDSVIQLFNPSATQAVTATILFRRDFNWGQGGPWARSGVVIPPRGSYQFSLARDALAAEPGAGTPMGSEVGEELSAGETATVSGYLPDGYRGGGAVVATGPIQAQVMHTNYAQDVGTGYQGLAQESLTPRLAFPSLYASFGQGPWSSSLRVQNRTNRPVTLSFTFKADDGILEGGTWRRTGLALPALSSVEFYLDSSPLDGGGSLPVGFRGSAVVEATDPEVKLAGTAIHTNYWRGVANSYTGIDF